MTQPPQKKLTEVLIDLFKLYRENSSNLKYRIIKNPDAADPLVHFQVSGKSIVLKELPEKIMHSNLLMGFSKADVAILTYLGAKAELDKQRFSAKPKLLARIAQQLLGKGGNTKFLLKIPEQDQLVEAVPEEVMMNDVALDMLSSKDAAMLGYAAAENRLMSIRQQVVQAPTCSIIEHDFISNQVTYIDEERAAKHTLHLNDLFNNKKLLAFFRKIDQQLISFAAGEAYQQGIIKSPPVFTIVSQSKDIVEYIDENGVEHALPIQELAFNHDLLEQFSLAERERIIFAAGELHEQRLHPKKSISLTLKSYIGDVAQFIDLEGNIQSMRFQELAFQSELLDQFGQQDRDMIRFAAGEFSAQEKATL